MAIVYDRHGWRDTNDPAHYPSEEEVLVSLQKVTDQLRSSFNQPNEPNTGRHIKPSPTLEQYDQVQS